MLANDIPENDELMSVNFENISLRSLIEIMADHNEVNIEMEKLRETSMLRKYLSAFTI
ncbi:hypothetical protein NBRC116583_27600 [Arenicella sp. 4NH20-0111]